MKPFQRFFTIPKHSILGDLKDQAFGRQSGLVEGVRNGFDHRVVLKLAAGYIDSYRQPGRNVIQRVPQAGLPAGLAQYPLAEGKYKIGFFRDRDKFGRRDQTFRRMMPSTKGFHTHHRTGFEIYDWLVMELKLAA